MLPRWLAFFVRAALLLIWSAALLFYWWGAPSSSNRHTLGALGLSYLVVWGGLFFWSEDPIWLDYLGMILAIPLSLFGSHLARNRMQALEIL